MFYRDLKPRGAVACSRLLERSAKERARGRKRRGPVVFVPSPSSSRVSLGAWNRLEAQPSGFRPDKTRTASFLNAFKNIPGKACVKRVHNNDAFCERWKLAYEKNINHRILIRRRFYRI